MNALSISVISWSKEMAKHANEIIRVIKNKESYTSWAQGETMPICSLSSYIVHSEFLEQGQTLNQCCYLEIVARLHEAWLVFHDSAPARDMLAVSVLWLKYQY